VESSNLFPIVLLPRFSNESRQELFSLGEPWTWKNEMGMHECSLWVNQQSSNKQHKRFAIAGSSRYIYRKIWKLCEGHGHCRQVELTCETPFPGQLLFVLSFFNFFLQVFKRLANEMKMIRLLSWHTVIPAQSATGSVLAIEIHVLVKKSLLARGWRSFYSSGYLLWELIKYNAYQEILFFVTLFDCLSAVSLSVPLWRNEECNVLLVSHGSK
jgi:hypothetical protein